MARSIRGRSTVRWSRYAILIAISLLSGCQQSGDPGSTDGDAGTLRIVSLSPAISRTLVDLGLGDAVVGRTPWCRALPESVPVAGDLLHVDYERLVRLEPTHVLVQPPASGLDRRLTELADARGWRLARWTLNTRRDIEQLIRELPDVLSPRGGPFADALRARADALLQRIDRAVDGATDDLWRGRVLLVDSLDPVMVYGRHTYLDDLLTAFGSTNAAPVEGWRELSLEDVARLDPEAIVLVQETGQDGGGALAQLEVEAVRTGRIARLSNPDAVLPSSALADVAEELRDILRRLGEPSS